MKPNTIVISFCNQTDFQDGPLTDILLIQEFPGAFAAIRIASLRSQ